MTAKLIDSYGRRISNLRISITDRCNLACTYCVPEGGFQTSPLQELMSDEEILRLAGMFVQNGVQKIRLTGGEPLLRPGVVNLVHALRALSPEFVLALSSNGVLLERFATPLAAAGLSHVNVSLDSFNPQRFKTITGGGNLARVMRGIHAALEAGMTVKVNAVTLPTLDDGDLQGFLGMALEHPVEIRFIEYMPLNGSGYRPGDFLSNQTLLQRFRRLAGLTPELRPGEKAQTYLVDGGPGRLGFISSLSKSFCGACNRMRLSATGELRPCLFSGLSFPLLPLLRSGADDEELLTAIRRAVWRKPEGHHITPGSLAKLSPGDTALIRTIGG